MKTILAMVALAMAFSGLAGCVSETQSALSADREWNIAIPDKKVSDRYTIETAVKTQGKSDLIAAGEFIFLRMWVGHTDLGPSPFSTTSNPSTSYWSMSVRSFALLDTKTGTLKELAELLPGNKGKQLTEIPRVAVSPDARYALMEVHHDVTSENVRRFYLLELKTKKVTLLGDVFNNKEEKMFVSWRDGNSFYATRWSDQKPYHLLLPEVYDLTGKKIGSLDKYVIPICTDENGTLFAWGSPENLNSSPNREDFFNKSDKVLILDKSGKIVKAIDGNPVPWGSHNGKYIVSRRWISSGEKSHNIFTVVSNDGTQGVPFEMEWLFSVSDTGEVIGAEEQDDDRPPYSIAMWEISGKKTLLANNIHLAGIDRQGETLYYIAGDDLTKLRAVKLSKLRQLKIKRTPRPEVKPIIEILQPGC